MKALIFALSLAALLLAGCQVVIIPVDMSLLKVPAVATVMVGPVEATPVMVGPVEATPVAVGPVEATPVEVGPVEEEIRAQLDSFAEICDGSITHAQEDKAIKDGPAQYFVGKEITLVGRIRNVYGTDTIIDLVDSPHYVMFRGLTEEQALSLNKNELVTFVGELEMTNCSTHRILHGTLTVR